MTERQLDDCVARVARVYGWTLSYHSWSSIHSAAGFPDRVFVRPPRLVFVELKRLGGKVSPEQRAWLMALETCPGIEVYLWTPADWMAGEVERVLGRIDVEVSRCPTP
jgi:hypothetical protein